MELKKHLDTIAIISTIVVAVLWMNGQFNSIDRRFASLEKDMAIMKTILVMKDICPKELASSHEVK